MTTELCSLMNFGNSVPMLRASYQLKLKTANRDPFALECVYALMMIDFLSNKIDHESYANEVLDIEHYRLGQINTLRIVEQLMVFDMVRILGLVKCFSHLDREIDRVFASAINVIPNKTLQRILAAKIHHQWPSSTFHLIHSCEEKRGDQSVKRLNSLPPTERKMFSSIYCLFLFITNRVEYYEVMEQHKLQEVDDQIALLIPKQLAELERALLMCSLPTDELDLYVLKDQLTKFREDCRKVNVYNLVEIVQVDCWHSVHKYISDIEANLTKW